MKSSGHYSAAIRQELLFSIKWDVTTLKLNQFHSSKKFLTADNCVRCHGSLIALGGKIPNVSYIVAKMTTFCLGRSLQMIRPVLRKK